MTTRTETGQGGTRRAKTRLAILAGSVLALALAAPALARCRTAARTTLAQNLTADVG